MRHMTKRALSLLLTLAMLCGLLITTSLAVDAEPWDGSTTTQPELVDGYYLISNGAELAWFANQVNGTLNVTDSQPGLNARLTADIDLNNQAWTPISNYYSASTTPGYDTSYTGTFDGNGHKITGLNVVGDANQKMTGLFGYTKGGTIKNLAVYGTVKTNTSNGYYSGGIVGYCYGVTIENCANYATVTGYYAGGLIGATPSGRSLPIVITNSYNAGDVIAYTEAGGLVGEWMVVTGDKLENAFTCGTISKAPSSNAIRGTVCGYGTVSGIISNFYYLNAQEYSTSHMDGTGKSAEEFTTLASDLGSAFVNSEELGHPVLTWEVAGSGSDDSGPAMADYEMYLELSVTNDTDSDGVYEVNPGDTLTATLYVKSDSAQSLSGYDATISYDSLLGVVVDEEKSSFTEGLIIAGNGSIQLSWCDLGQLVPLEADTPYALAVFNVTVPAAGTVGLAYNTPMELSLTNTRVTDLYQAGAQKAEATGSELEILTTYTITWNVDGTETQESVPYGQTPVYSGGTPVKDGYTFTGWTPTLGEAIADVTYEAQWAANTYTITYNTNGGDALEDTTYTSDTAPVLGTPTYEGFVLDHWEVTSVGEQGNWTVGETIAPDADLSGRYGDVTLKAVWQSSLRFVTEDYRYAFEDGVLLIVAGPTPENGQCYLYNGEPMFYTEDPNYTSSISGSTGVYLYIISKDDTDIADKITVGAGENVTIARNGDVTGDGVVEFDDATTVNVMVLGATYWSNDPTASNYLSIQARLEADVSTDTTGSDLRGTIADVAAIVAILAAKD